MRLFTEAPYTYLCYFLQTIFGVLRQATCLLIASRIFELNILKLT